MIYEPPQRQACGVYATRKLIAVNTMSGWGSLHGDDKGIRCLLAPDATDTELGEAVLLALSKSRIIHPDLDPDLFSNSKGAERYYAWVEDLMQTYGYRTKSALFREMLHPDIEVRNGQMTVSPTKRQRGDGFGPTLHRERDYVHLPADSSPDEVGAAVRLALSRCR